MRVRPVLAVLALWLLGLVASSQAGAAPPGAAQVPPPPPKAPVPTGGPAGPAPPGLPPRPAAPLHRIAWTALAPPAVGPIVPPVAGGPAVPAPFRWATLDRWLRAAEARRVSPRIEIVFPASPAPRPPARRTAGATPPRPAPVLRQSRPRAWASFLRELRLRYTGRLDPDAAGPAGRLPRVGHWHVTHLEHSRRLKPREPLRSTLVPTLALRPLDVLGAGPIVTPTDHADVRAKELRVTFSPNGDGIADAVDLLVTGPPGHAVQASAWWPWRRTRNTVWRSTPVRLDARGEARLRWDGRGAGRRPIGDGSYTVGVCLLDAVRRAPTRAPGGPAPAVGTPPPPAACAPQVVRAHRRTLAAGILSTGSFLPGASVPLTIGTDHGAVTVGVLRDDNPEAAPAAGLQTVEAGVPVSYVLPADLAPGTHRLAVTDALGERRLLPLVVRDPTSPLEAPAPGTTLVVAPYLTWRAYNGWDEDRSGRADTWYANFNGRGWVSLVGPYEDIAARASKGAEFDHRYARNFMAWFRGQPGRQAQFVTDLELAAMDPAVLRRYRAVVFPGHTEYYPQRLYELVRDYRDGGGRVAFLSANNFFQTVEVQPELSRVQAGVRALRTPTQSDFALVGVGFMACCRAEAAWPAYTLNPGAAARVPWLLAGTGLGDGAAFGRFGDEADGASPELSPPGLVLIASGTVGGRVLSMSYYETPGGGEVFSTGNMRFLDLMSSPVPGQDPALVHRLLDNLWAHLVR